MYTVTLDYLENGILLSGDVVYETEVLAVACAMEFADHGNVRAVFVTDAMGETVYCYEV